MDIIEIKKIFNLIENGATIFGDKEAHQIKELSKAFPGAIKLIPISELEEIECEIFQGERLAYFGAILTPKGKKILGIMSGRLFIKNY